jgi:hypothetical protein
MFDETQVTKVDAVQGSIRELHKEVQAQPEGEAPTASLLEFMQKARTKSSELMAHLEEKANADKHSKEHYKTLMLNMAGVNDRLTNLDVTTSKESLDAELSSIENDIMQLTVQSPYTLLMMRVVEIGLPVLLSLFSIFFVLRYSLTEKRSHEIKELIRVRNEDRLNGEKN